MRYTGVPVCFEVASSGAADYLVTGNQRHFVPVRGTHEIHIITARELLDRL